MANIMKLMKQVNRMKDDFAKAQEDLAARVLDYTSGGGAVKIQITGDGRIQSIKLDPQAVDPSDVAMLEDLLLAAVKGAQDMARETGESEMGKIASGLNLPPGFGF